MSNIPAPPQKVNPAALSNTPTADHKSSEGEKPSAKKQPKKRPHSFFNHLGVQDKINFTRHLAIVIKAGMPLYEGLRVLRRQAGSNTLIRIIDDLMEDVNNGRFLADGLQRYEKIFGSFYINIIRVGESSGTLSQNLLYLADELKKAKLIKNKIRAAMVYPVIILVATLIVTSFLTFFVFPKILPLFLSLNVKLPPTTRALISFLTFSKEYGAYVILGAVVLIFLIRLVLRKVPPVKYAVDLCMLYTPGLGKLLVALNLANLCRVLGLLLKSGVRIVEALLITSHTFNSLVYKRSIERATEEIRKGGQFATFLGSHRNLYPTILSEMVEVGENTGNLEENLVYLSEYYTEEIDAQIHNFTSLLEPLLILMMGLFVGFVAVSIILPIYTLSQGLSN
jgi:type II secretory pathway component PulF